LGSFCPRCGVPIGTAMLLHRRRAGRSLSPVLLLFAAILIGLLVLVIIVVAVNLLPRVARAPAGNDPPGSNMEREAARPTGEWTDSLVTDHHSMTAHHGNWQSSILFDRLPISR